MLVSSLSHAAVSAPLSESGKERQAILFRRREVIKDSRTRSGLIKTAIAATSSVLHEIYGV